MSAIVSSVVAAVTAALTAVALWAEQVFEKRVVPLLIPIVEQGHVPDFLIRLATRIMLWHRLKSERAGGIEQRRARHSAFVQQLKTLPIAMATPDANAQHYEVPARFYELVLGPHLKYSCGLWPSANTTLEQSEAAMLELVIARADIRDGHTVMDLGCGWGSCGLFIAQRFPNARVLCVSNSKSQRRFIEERARTMGLRNISVETGDVNEYTTTRQFDRIVSNEMFEHMKNYEALMAKVASWMKSGGKLFVHIFTHNEFSYHFEDGWMAKTFFTGGTMPSDGLLLYFQNDLKIENHWRVNGTHYQRTLEAWLQVFDAKREQLTPVLRDTYGAANVTKWRTNWRMFFMLCAELFGYDSGNEWGVSHYTFVKP